jgi:pimeloyl-ACP methyl ester carboxylesterase
VGVESVSIESEGGEVQRQIVVLAVFMMAVLLVGCGGRTTTEEAAGPVTGPGMVASADGVEIAYTVHRIGAPNLVLVHGWMCDQTYWDEQVPVLAEAFGVVTVDLAGHGGSGVNRASWTIASLGDDVAAVIEKTGLDQVIVAGHSMGGRVALDVARKLPDTVIGIIAVDTFKDVSAEWDPEEVEQFISALEEDFLNSCNGFVRSMFVEDTAAAIVDEVASDMCSGPGEIGAALIRAYVAFDLREGFAQAGVPIRAINGDKSPTNVEANRELADFEVTLLEGYGHFLMQEAPEELSQAMIDTTLAIVMGKEPNDG